MCGNPRCKPTPGSGTLAPVASFVVEQYLPDSTRDSRNHEIERVRAARDQLGALGARHLGSLAIPADEMCMHIFEAEREADLIVAYRRSRLPYDRIVEIELTR